MKDQLKASESHLQDRILEVQKLRSEVTITLQQCNLCDQGHLFLAGKCTKRDQESGFYKKGALTVVSDQSPAGTRVERSQEEMQVRRRRYCSSKKRSG